MQRSILIAILVTAAVAAGVYYTVHHMGSAQLSHEQLWSQFKQDHNKTYSHAEEEQYRLSVFRSNLQRIKEYQENDKGAKYGVTKFADLTKEEFRTQILGLHSKPKTGLTDVERNVYKPTVKDIPASFDWRTKNAVTPVKNQGSCGSCWAFSAIQNIEGQNAIKHGQLLTLSEQELVDCDKVDQGCDGGLMETAMEFFRDNGGVVQEKDYPYTGQDGSCTLNKSEAAVQVTGYVNVSSDETVIAQSLVELGPLSIAVHADPWQFYWSGVSNPWFCTGDLDHGVLLVGYGHGSYWWVSESDYWIIKNSWGESWGESGYIRLVRGKGVCGMNQDVISGTIA